MVRLGAFDDDGELLSALRRVAQGHAAERLDLPGAEMPPVLERYRVVRRIGEGGAGIVYEAEQDAPRRSVALKVLRPGLTSKRTLRRFEFESEILSRLDHPSIAKVFEAGSDETADGPRPWFAMEMVDGLPLSVWVAERGPDRRARLELFARLCDAVHHAHQKGVVHRDLKPANVLVDAAGRPVVLDFGVARVAETRTTTLRTLEGQIIGTLPYMSPEQVAGDPDAVDVRCDVYALGVVLYELLTERRPVALERLSLAEAARAIEEVPAPPLSSHDASLAGDLEVVVAKALEKDRERRYASAAALGEEVQRVLRGEPIAARAPGRLEQLARSARRHKTLVGALAAVLVVLAAGAAVASFQAVRALRAESDLRDALAQAEAEGRRARAAAEFLQSILEQADPDRSEEPTIRDVLETAAARVETELAGEPLVESQVRAALGRAYMGLDDQGRARENLERALELSESVLGDGHPEQAGLHAALAEQALHAAEHGRVDEHVARVEALSETGAVEARVVAAATRTLGQARYYDARFDEAQTLLERAIELFGEALGEDDIEVAHTKRSLALVRSGVGDGAGAIELLREVLAAQRREFGPRKPATANTLDLLGGILLREGELEQAEELAREAFDIRRERLGEEHTGTALSLRTLGLVAFADGDLERAEELLRDSAGRMRRANGAHHHYTTQGLLLVAQVLVARGDVEAAERVARETLAGCEGMDAGQGIIAGGARRFLAEALAGLGRPEEAEAEYRASLATLRAIYPEGHGQVLAVRASYGGFLTDEARYADAEAELSSALEAAEAASESHPMAPRLQERLDALYDVWERPEPARSPR